MGWFETLGILYPGALYLLAIPPFLLLAYLARERPRQAIVSSVIAFRALHAMRGERFGGRPRLNWTFFVELLILCLAVLTLAGPYLTRKGNPLAIVLDTSAPMQARSSSGKSRFETARAKLADTLRGEHPGEVTLYVTAPQPHQIGGVFAGTATALEALDRFEVTDSPEDPAAVSRLIAELSANPRLGRVVFVSYRAIASPAPARVTAITIGEPVANYAIGEFVLSRENFGNASLHGRVTAANFSPAAQNLTVTITGDGKPAGRAQARVEAGEVAALDFPNLGAAQVYRAQLEPHDGFELDNVAYATASAVKGVSILFVSPTPADGASLRSIPGVSVNTVAPAGYSPAELNRADLAIFEYAVPKELPLVNSLLVMPPPGDPIFNFTVKAAPRLSLTGWLPVDPLNDGVNFRLLNFRSGQYFGVHPWMHEVISGAGGALLMTGDRQGHRFIATGFNPLPYLGRTNLPMSILTLNLLSYLAQVGTQASALHTGDVWNVPAGVKEIVLPSGRKESVHGAQPFSSASQGIYELVDAGDQKTLRAVNLADLTTSDLERVAPLKIESASAPLTAEQAMVRTPLAPYLLAIILALVAIESLLVYRRKAPGHARFISPSHPTGKGSES